MATLRQLLGYGKYIVAYKLMAGIVATEEVRAGSEEEAERKFRMKYPKKKIIKTRTVY